MRFLPEVFVDRERELRLLGDWIKKRMNVLMVGLRGYGKSSLLMKLLAILGCEHPGVYVNCLLVYNGEDLLDGLREELLFLSEKGCLEFDVDALDLALARSTDTRDYLKNFYSLLRKHKIAFVVFDEISTLLKRFGAQKPFRGAGGARAMAEFFKGLLDTYKDIATIFADTSINFHYELFREYSGPLFREYQAMLELEPLSLEDTVTLVRAIAKHKQLKIDDELALYIADVSGGVPVYVEMLIALAREEMNLEGLEGEIEKSLTLGLLNKYFEALLDKFSWTEQEVLYAIAKGKTRFLELQRDISGCAQALDSLEKKGMIINVKKGPKESYYLIKDKLFATWLAIKEKPGLRKISYKKARLLTAGFEALIREMFFTLQQRVVIHDELNRELEIDPPQRVYRYEGALGEIDMIAEYKDNTAVIAEIYLGYNCKKRKIDQLLQNIGIAERLKYKVRYGLLISYFEVPQQTLQYAKKLARNTPIHILTHKQLKEISKHSLIRIP